MNHKTSKSIAAAKAQGFSLIELMTGVAIVGILAVFAVPAYQSYVSDSERGVVTTNIYTIEMFQEDYMLRNGNYANDLVDIDAIDDEIGWRPQTDDGILYAIGASDGTTYEVTATHPGGLEICIEFPGRDLCDA